MLITNNDISRIYALELSKVYRLRREFTDYPNDRGMQKHGKLGINKLVYDAKEIDDFINSHPEVFVSRYTKKQDPYEDLWPIPYPRRSNFDMLAFNFLKSNQPW